MLDQQRLRQFLRRSIEQLDHNVIRFRWNDSHADNRPQFIRESLALRAELLQRRDVISLILLGDLHVKLRE